MIVIANKKTNKITIANEEGNFEVPEGYIFLNAQLKPTIVYVSEGISNCVGCEDVSDEYYAYEVSHVKLK
jgi:hypothetical protein